MAPGSGIAIGVWQHGVRRVFTYGAAKPDSLFQIGSITKTFTGLELMLMVAQGKVRLNEPVRELLPSGTVRKPARREITLLDLATHQSGLLAMPTNVEMNEKPNPGASYRPVDLYDYIAERGLAKNPNTTYQYSNLGYALLGMALAERAGTSYPDLVHRDIAGPLGLKDTVISPSAEQEAHTIQGYDEKHHLMSPWKADALAPAGTIRSTAGDMLTYLVANLHPETVAATSPALSKALSQSHELKSDVSSGVRIAIAWFYSKDTGIYWHDGAISGYTSYAFFHPVRDFAVAVLRNDGTNPMALSSTLGVHILQRMTGEPALTLAPQTIPQTGGILGLLRFRRLLDHHAGGRGIRIRLRAGRAGTRRAVVAAEAIPTGHVGFTDCGPVPVPQRLFSAAAVCRPDGAHTCTGRHSAGLVAVVLVPGTIPAVERLARLRRAGAPGVDRPGGGGLWDGDSLRVVLSAHAAQDRGRA